MKIVHIAPKAPYNENWGYQDNLLPKYQRKEGHDVTVIITTRTYDGGCQVEVEPIDYTLTDGVRLIRLRKKRYPHRVITALCSKLDVYDHLKQIKPDFIFYHSLGSTTIFDVVRYKKKINPSCVIVRDNHQDYNNSKLPQGIKGLFVRSVERYIVRKTMPYVSRVYGVTPWRQKFSEEYFGVPATKTDVLIMGADDEQMSIKMKESIRAKMRQKYDISNQDFLVVTGGKIDAAKNIHILMEACKTIPGIKLLVFGTVSEEIKKKFDEIASDSDNIIYVGWIDASKVYEYFFAADLVFFPGGHSVMWEQACAAKVPCVFRKWDGMEHLNNGGNSVFLNTVTQESIREMIEELLFTPTYFMMKSVAESEATDIYLYSQIAKKSLECAIPL